MITRAAFGAWVLHEQAPLEFIRWLQGRKYELILKNKEAGGELEQAVLKARSQEKNRALMMPPPDSKAQGFIPDAVPGSPTPGELVWGQPYRFMEVKGRKELALTGNLKAMIEYVEEHGGFIELWVRSPKHPNGATSLTDPLLKRLRYTEAKGQCGAPILPALRDLNAMKYFETFFSLPPGTPPGSLVREFFHLAFERYSWFRPVQYGRAFTDGRLDPDRIDFDALVAFYERYRNITVTARTERDYLLLYPEKSNEYPYVGKLIWATSVKEATKPAWRAAHLRQVLEAMQSAGGLLWHRPAWTEDSPAQNMATRDGSRWPIDDGDLHGPRLQRRPAGIALA